LQQSNRSDIERAVAKLEGLTDETVILDLRMSGPEPDPDICAAVAGLFISKGEELFRLVRGPSSPSRIFTSQTLATFAKSRVIILIDCEVTGAAEALAGAMRERNRALVVGENSSGLWAETGKLTVEKDFVLNVGSGEFQLPDGKSRVGSPLVPDIAVKFSLEEKWKVAERTKSEGLAFTVHEVERPRFNEAALVAGINPELAGLDERSADGKQPDRSKKAPDPVIKAAIDLAETLRVYRPQIEDGKPPTPSSPTVP
jgi:C-terminal processing protease CtpA/Prc